jgi:ankyrin repeat protein
LLIEANAYPDINAVDVEGQTALSLAVTKNNGEIIGDLLDSSADMKTSFS